MLDQRGQLLRAALDHMICPLEDGLRDRQAECFRRYQVDEQLEFGGLFDRQIGGLRSLENLSHITRNTRGLKNTVWPIEDSKHPLTTNSRHGAITGNRFSR